MKNLLILIMISIISLCSFFIVVDNTVAGSVSSYTTPTPEALLNRIDYYQRVIWQLEYRYRTNNPNKMYPRDRQIYITAKRNLNKAIAEYNSLIRSKQYQQKGYYHKY